MFGYVCRVDVEPVRAEPRDDAEQVTQLLEGEPVALGERRDEWVRITTAYGYPGWVRADAVEPGSGAPAPVRGGDPVELARAFLGAPYEWGGMTEHGIDCSGLVHMSFRRAGRLVPRDAADQERAGERVVERAAVPGDLITYGGEHATHIAFWVGGGRVLHASGAGGVRRVLEEDEPAALRAIRRYVIRL